MVWSILLDPPDALHLMVGEAEPRAAAAQQPQPQHGQPPAAHPRTDDLPGETGPETLRR